jgi:adenylylsulfate kinase
VCQLLTKHGVPNIAAAISPYREVREEVRKMVGRFVEVYVKCPVEVCEQRDTKGLYRKARLGEIKQFTGVDDPYKEPLNPEVVVSTDRETVEESAVKVIRKLEELGWLPR